MEASKFHFYSFGKVAANKPSRNRDGSICDLVEVFPQERFTMSAGEITDNVEKINVKGKDASGKDYEGEIETKPSITCKWLPIGEPNRITPPDVRRDEQVIIYRYADTEYYFWSSAFNDIVRKLETVAWWFSGTPKDGDDADTSRTADNGYFVEISSHHKHVIFSTSKANGEVVRYYLQFNMKDGNFLLKDDLGQSFVIDSDAGIVEVTSESQIIHNTKKMISNCEEFIVNASSKVDFNTPIVTMSKNLNVKGSTLLVGMVNMTAGLGGGSWGDTEATLSFQGNVEQRGSWTTYGEQVINGNFKVNGTGLFTGNISAPNI